MPVVNVNLLVDEKTYAGVMSGALELCGMAKNADNKRVVKHLAPVADAAKEGAVKAVDFIREHKKGALIVGGVLIVGGAVAGTVSYFATRNKRKLEKEFGENLQVYLEAAKEGRLTLDILNSLIQSLDAMVKDNPANDITLKITPAQFSDLIQCIFRYTVNLAEANNMSPTLINKPKMFKKKTYSDLQYYLNMQKEIFERAA